MKKLGIKNTPENDRPYEKFEKYGAKYLSDAELLSIIIKSGSKKSTCLDIAKFIMSKHEDGLEGFEYVKNVSLDELKTISGIGRVKAIQIKVLVEIANRIYLNKDTKKKITCPQDVYNILAKDMQDMLVEETRLIILDSKAHIKSITHVSLGAMNKSVVSIKEVLSEPIKQMAASIIIVHNHPSGDSTPSRQDIAVTGKIKEYASMFEIDLLDHIIIGKGEYTSIKEFNSEIFLRGSII